MTYIGTKPTECKVRVTNLKADDSRTWSVRNVDDLKASEIEVVIAKPVSTGSISVGPTDGVVASIKAGEHTRLACQWDAGKPAPLVSFQIANFSNAQIVNGTEVQTPDDDGNYVTMYEKYVNATPADFGKVLSCQASQFDNLNQTLFGTVDAEEIRLNVTFPAQPMVKQKVSGEMGGEVNVAITFQANPAPTGIRWLIKEDVEPTEEEVEEVTDGQDDSESDNEESEDGEGEGEEEGKEDEGGEEGNGEEGIGPRNGEESSKESGSDDEESEPEKVKETVLTPGHKDDKFVAAEVMALEANKYKVELTIKRLTKEDAEKTYEVEVTNSNGVESYSYELTVTDEDSGAEGGGDGEGGAGEEEDGEGDGEEEEGDGEEEEGDGEGGTAEPEADGTSSSGVIAIVVAVILVVIVVLLGIFFYKKKRSRVSNTPLTSMSPQRMQ